MIAMEDEPDFLPVHCSMFATAGAQIIYTDDRGDSGCDRMCAAFA